MSNYEEMAKAAVAEQQRRKEEARAQARASQDAEIARRQELQSYLDKTVRPILQEAAKGFKAADIETHFDDTADPIEPRIAFVVGHNRAGQTLNRVARLRARLVDGNLQVTVTAPARNEETWRADKANPKDALDPALEKCLDIWTEKDRSRFAR